MNKRSLSMLIVSTLLLGITPSFSAPINITGKITDDSGKPIPLATVTLKNADLSTLTDENGVYRLEGNDATPVIEQAISANSLVPKVVGSHLNFSIPYSRRVKVDLYSITGRYIGEVMNDHLSSGTYSVNPFKEHRAKGFYLLTYSDGVTAKTLKAVNTGAVSSNTTTPLVSTASTTTPNSRGTAGTLDTLTVTSKEGSEITSIPVTSLVDSLPTMFIVQRNISGGFNGGPTLRGIGSITALLKEEGIDEPKRMVLGYNKANNSYSGFVYSLFSSEIKNYSVEVFVTAPDSILTGKSKLVEFNSQLGDIDVPAFNLNNHLPQPEGRVVVRGDTIVGDFFIEAGLLQPLASCSTIVNWSVNGVEKQIDTVVVSSDPATSRQTFQVPWLPAEGDVLGNEEIVATLTPYITAPFFSLGIPFEASLQLTGTSAPYAANLKITNTGDSLVGTYDFTHADPLVTEGNTILKWYRNSEQIDSGNLNISIPEGVTAADTLYFEVHPVAANGITLQGPVNRTALVVADLPKIEVSSIEITYDDDSLHAVYSLDYPGVFPEGNSEFFWYRGAPHFGGDYPGQLITSGIGLKSIPIPEDLSADGDNLQLTIVPVVDDGFNTVGISKFTRLFTHMVSLPTAKDLDIRSANDSLYAIYTYEHHDTTIPEGNTRFHWYRNGELFDSAEVVAQPTDLLMNDTIRLVVTPGAAKSLVRIGNPVSFDKTNLGGIENIDEFLANQNSYDAAYRYAVADTLGARGGVGSGGFRDSWGTETQCQIAVPKDSIVLNGAKVNFNADESKFYWIGLALAQEIAGYDFQMMAGIAGIETGAGFGPQRYQGISLSHLQTPWHIEQSTAQDRYYYYKEFYQKYKESNSFNNEFFQTYCGDNKLDQATAVSSAMMYCQMQEIAIDVHEEAARIFWKEALTEAVSADLGVTVLLSEWNKGLSYQLNNSAAIFADSTWRATAANSDPLSIMGMYPQKVMPIIRALTEASKQSLTDNRVELLDFQLTKAELKEIFFGVQGTAVQQGNGGLLQHWHYDSSDPKRAEIDGLLNSYFDRLKGQAPSTTGTETISFRYDLLFIVRSLKETLQFLPPVPDVGVMKNYIEQYS